MLEKRVRCGRHQSIRKTGRWVGWGNKPVGYPRIRCIRWRVEQRFCVEILRYLGASARVPCVYIRAIACDLRSVGRVGHRGTGKLGNRLRGRPMLARLRWRERQRSLHRREGKGCLLRPKRTDTRPSWLHGATTTAMRPSGWGGEKSAWFQPSAWRVRVL